MLDGASDRVVHGSCAGNIFAVGKGSRKLTWGWGFSASEGMVGVHASPTPTVSAPEILSGFRFWMGASGRVMATFAAHAFVFFISKHPRCY